MRIGGCVLRFVVLSAIGATREVCTGGGVEGVRGAWHEENVRCRKRGV